LNTRYEENITKIKVAHLLYVDDLKLIGETEEEFQTVKTLGDDINMEFGLEKCAKIVLKKGKLFHSQNLIFDINREIQEVEEGETYKYLGIEESEGVEYQQMRETLKKVYTSRLRMILKS
jgi:hypothetical protein